MTMFTIDADNSITAFGTKQDADGAQGESFSTQQELAELAGKWPANRLVEVWNGIPGLSPVKKFTDRKSALARIWRAIQSLNGNSAADAASGAPKPPAKAAQAPKPVKKTARSGKAKPTKTAKGKNAKAVAKPAAARDGSKKAEVLAPPAEGRRNAGPEFFAHLQTIPDADAERRQLSGRRDLLRSASKFALEAVSEALVQELRAFGVRVAMSSLALSIRAWPAILRA